MSDSIKDKDSKGDQDKDFLEGCNSVCGFCFSLITLVFLIISVAALTFSASDFNHVVDTWQQSPITDIVVGSPCPADYTRLHSYWPGTYDSCVCGPGTNRSSSDTRKCTESELGALCRTRLGEPAVDLIVGNLTICYKRSGPNALSRSQPFFSQNGTVCPSDTRPCGSGNSTICFPSSEPNCPIVDLGFTTQTLTNAVAQADGSALTAQGTLFFSRSSRLNSRYFPLNRSLPKTLLPLVELVFQPNDPCISGCGYKREWVSPRVKEIPCDVGCKESNGPSYTGRDTRYFRIMNISEQALYANAGIDPVYISSNPDYVWYVSARSEVYWSPLCPSTRKRAVGHESELGTVVRCQNVQVTNATIGFIILAIFTLPRWYYKSLSVKKSKWEKYILTAAKIISVICTIVVFIIAIVNQSFWTGVSNYNRALTNNTASYLDMNPYYGCSDNLTDYTFKVLGGKYSDFAKDSALQSGSSGVSLVTDIFVNTWRHYNPV